MHTVSKRKFDFRAFAFFEILTLGAGLLSGFVSGTAGFERLIKPPLTPPAFVFPLVWTVLYALMAFAAYLVFNTDDIDRGAPLRMYLLQLLVNVLWPVFFFRLEWRLFSFFWLLLLIALVTLTMTGFKYIRPAAYYLDVYKRQGYGHAPRLPGRIRPAGNRAFSTSRSHS